MLRVWSGEIRFQPSSWDFTLTPDPSGPRPSLSDKTGPGPLLQVRFSRCTVPETWGTEGSLELSWKSLNSSSLLP